MYQLSIQELELFAIKVIEWIEKIENHEMAG